jgi:hypothetical protein
VLAPRGYEADAHIGRGAVISVKIGRTAGGGRALNHVAFREDDAVSRSGAKASLSMRLPAELGAARSISNRSGNTTDPKA